jgi:hypothetical protein
LAVILSNPCVHEQGKVTGSCTERHRQQEYVEFLKLVDRKTPKRKVLHLVLDNSSGRNTKGVQGYLQSRQGRYVVHLTLDPRLVAELGGAVVRGDHDEAHPQGQLQ